jgi:hypothetical protein
MEEAGSGHEESCHNILTLNALHAQDLSRSAQDLGLRRICLGLRYPLELSMSMRTRPIGKSLHTYIHTYLSLSS